MQGQFQTYNPFAKCDSVAYYLGIGKGTAVKKFGWISVAKSWKAKCTDGTRYQRSFWIYFKVLGDENRLYAF